MSGSATVEVAFDLVIDCDGKGGYFTTLAT
jgi:hypothetical protein